MTRANQVLVILAFLAIGGCARAPSGGATGTRLAVTLRFADAIQDSSYYFFIIRNGADPNGGANGPVAVLDVPYGNGFATAAHPGDPTAGLTDYVEYSRAQPGPTTSGFGLYHLTGGISGNPNNPAAFFWRGEPEVTQAPNGGTTLYFELAISRLQPPSGEPDPNNGQPARYLQINVVATSRLPVNSPITDPLKFVDAFGDQQQFGSRNYYITIDTKNTGTPIQSSPNPGDPNYEPDNDTFPGPANVPGIELIGWTIQIKG